MSSHTICSERFGEAILLPNRGKTDGRSLTATRIADVFGRMGGGVSAGRHRKRHIEQDSWDPPRVGGRGGFVADGWRFEPGPRAGCCANPDSSCRADGSDGCDRGSAAAEPATAG